MFFKKKKVAIEDEEEIIELTSAIEVINETTENDIIDESKNLESDNLYIDNIEEQNKTEEELEIDDNTAKEEEKDKELPIITKQGSKIYILGENALSIYLASKFTNSGEEVVVIPSKEMMTSLNNSGVTIIENHNLQRTNHKFNTTFWLKETPKMLIITSDANKINSAITSLSRKKVENVPVVMFTQIRDIKYIKDILKNDIYRAFFDGYLLNSRLNQITLYGRSPSVTLCEKEDSVKNKFIKECFEKAGLSVKLETDEIKNFWENFGVYTACSLISSAYNKNIFDVIKDKEKREKMIPVISEICNLANADGVKVNQDDILKRIYNTPLSYPYPLQVSISQGKNGDIDMISSNIVGAASKNKMITPEISSLLKKIYSIIMS